MATVDAEKKLQKRVLHWLVNDLGYIYLVNLEYVDRVDNNSVLIGEEHIQVSRARKKALLDALNNYINEVSK